MAMVVDGYLNKLTAMLVHSTIELKFIKSNYIPGSFLNTVLNIPAINAAALC